MRGFRGGADAAPPSPFFGLVDGRRPTIHAAERGAVLGRGTRSRGLGYSLLRMHTVVGLYDERREVECSAAAVYLSELDHKKN